MKKTKLLACALCAMSLTAAAAGAANTVTAVPTRETGQTVYFDASSAAPLDGDPQGLVRVYPTAYNISGSNYFKLRDLAALIGFSVDWDSATGTVLIAPRRVKSDLSLQDTATSAVQATASTAVCKVGRYQTFGAPADYSQSIPATIQTYNIGGNNYVKLRDIADLVKFEVKFDTVSKTVDLYKYNNGSSEVRKLATDNGVGSQSITNNTAQSTTTTNNNTAAANASTGTTSQSTTTTSSKPWWETDAAGEFTPISDALYDKLVQASLKYVNEERAKVGVAPLQHNPLLTKSAKWWAEQMAINKEFRHTNGADLLRMEQEYGIYAMDAKAAENCAITIIGDLTESTVDEVAKKVVAQYVNSPAHYKIMTDTGYDPLEFIGFGFALTGDNNIWSVQQYGDDNIGRSTSTLPNGEKYRSPFWNQLPEEVCVLGVKVENGKTIYYLDLVNYPSLSEFEGQVPEIVFD